MKFLVINASPNKHGNTSKFVSAFIEAAKNTGDVKTMNLHENPPQYSRGATEEGTWTEYQKAVVECDALFIATPTYWFNVPAILKSFIEELDAIEEELDKRTRALGIAVYAPQGGELGVANALVFPLNHMSFLLAPVGYIFHRGISEDDWAWENIKTLPARMKISLGE